jgi:hypothetical protein
MITVTITFKNGTTQAFSVKAWVPHASYGFLELQKPDGTSTMIGFDQVDFFVVPTNSIPAPPPPPPLPTVKH